MLKVKKKVKKYRDENLMQLEFKCVQHKNPIGLVGIKG